LEKLLRQILTIFNNFDKKYQLDPLYFLFDLGYTVQGDDRAIIKQAE
jgi:hypothetical protein